jgi:uncharacterized protein (DUF1684 family)
VTSSSESATPEVEEHRAAVEAAHAARVARLRSATGWLSLVGKALLAQGTTTIGSAPDAGARLPAGAPPRVGAVHVEGNVVTFEAAPGVEVTCEGERVTTRVLRSDRDGRADALVAGGFVLELMERGDALALRIRDTRELPRPFAGIERWPVDFGWRVRAKLVPYAEPRRIELDFEGAIGAVADAFFAPGVLVFEHGGRDLRLEPVYEDASRRRLFILFRDATSGVESYDLGRFLYAPLPDDNGTVWLDFNLAMLPGCAFTAFATCPIPPRENHLAIPVRAGERAYLGTLAHDGA